MPQEGLYIMFTKYESVQPDNSTPTFELNPLRFELPKVVSRVAKDESKGTNWQSNIHLKTPTVIQNTGYVPQNGDTVEINSDKNKKYGHTATYYNGSWYSDFKQNSMNPYNDPNAKIRIFRNPNREEAEQSAKLIASRAGTRSRHKCAQFVREGLNTISNGKYQAEGYNGNNFGEYLLKRNWTQVARKGGIIKAQEGFQFTKYESTPEVLNSGDLFELNTREYSLPAVIRRTTVKETKTPDWTTSIHLSKLDKLGPYNPDIPPVGKGFRQYQTKAYIDSGVSEHLAKLFAGQDALESAHGKSVSGTFNYGGIKGTGTTSKTKEYVNGKMVNTKASFRNFNSNKDYVNYKKNLLFNRYGITNEDTVDSAIDKLIKGGYATDPNYAKKLKQMLQ